MPEASTLARARKDRREGKSPSTQAGEFVREEFHHIREGKHGARSTRQAIAIGLSKARRAGVPLPAPKPGRSSAAARAQARRDSGAGRRPHPTSPARSRATTRALRREGHAAASPAAISRQTRRAASQRSAVERSASARHAARTRLPPMKGKNR
jgi:hypothetical protein